MEKKNFTTEELLKLEEMGIEVPEYRYIFAAIREGATDEEIMRKWNSARLYIKRVDDVLNFQIWQDIQNGEKVRSVARKYGVTEMHVYTIIKKKREEKLKKSARSEERLLF